MADMTWISPAANPALETEPPGTNRAQPADALQARVQAQAALPTAEVPVFGAQLFHGGAIKAPTASRPGGLNPQYPIAPGDRLSIQLWGPVQYREVLTVDPQGVIFLPDVGPLRVAGVRSDQINAFISSHVKKIFKGNVGVYAALDTMQPLQVYVTGFVRHPGVYEGYASDSPLAYLEQAGGIDPQRGSYVGIQVLRQGRPIQGLNLYDFLLAGTLPPLQWQHGDTLLVGPARHRVTVTGLVDNPYQFEFEEAQLDGSVVLRLARPRPDASHVRIRRADAPAQTSQYLPLAELARLTLHPGDTLDVTSDKAPATLTVRVEGEHGGPATYVLPHPARLSDLVAQLAVNPRAHLEALQLYRPAMATRQKEVLSVTLDNLQRRLVQQQSQTLEMANIRAKETDMLSRFIEKAKQAQPTGQIILGQPDTWQRVYLEEGDRIVIPAKSWWVATHGEVARPSVVVHHPGQSVAYYIQQSAGLAHRADAQQVLLLKANGAARMARFSDIPEAGDDLVVMPKVDAKSFQVVKDVSQLLFHLGLAARVVTAFR
jgi:protein involved in polysaccharide export with SLBB domain